MYARKVSVQLKPNSVAEFTQRMEKDVLPLLRKQKGFQDAITCLTTGRKEAFGLSLWDNKESAEAYSRGSYSEVTKFLAGVVEGIPQVESYDVSNSTFHNVASAPATA
jgi:heme-degrading monooxygenase HmoA